jgi:hypothetical protein
MESALFTAYRDVTIVSKDGSRCQRFEAGQTLPVVKPLHNVAIAAGLMPVEPSEIAPPEKAPAPRLSQEEEISQGLIKACKTLILRGNPDNFTQMGLPRAAEVKKLVDFSFTTKDMHRAFEQAEHEVNQDGDDSTEHSEPSSVAAE